MIGSTPLSKVPWPGDTIIDGPTPEVVAPKDTAQPVALEVTTTEEEVQGYELVKAIVSDVVDLDRVILPRYQELFHGSA